MTTAPDLILHNAKVSTLVAAQPSAEAIAIAGNRILAVGTDAEILPLATRGTRSVDAGRRRIIPGLIDSHIHVIRGGLNFNLELRWDGIPSLSEAMRLLRAQVDRTPATHWVRVVGGFTVHQDRKSTRLNSSHSKQSRMPSSA